MGIFVCNKYHGMTINCGWGLRGMLGLVRGGNLLAKAGRFCWWYCWCWEGWFSVKVVGMVDCLKFAIVGWIGIDGGIVISVGFESVA